MPEKFSFKEIIKNLIYSFVSFALPTAVLQFFVQPLIAAELGAEANGQYLTIMSLNYFFIGITGSVLNNVRLLQQKEYEKMSICGDFNIFLCIYAILSAVLVPIMWYYYTKTYNVIDILLMILVVWLYLYHDYVFAEYRLKLQYNKILVNNLLMTVGYLTGFLAFKMIKRWQIVFIAAYMIPTIYDFFNTTLIKEPVRKTSLFKQTAKKVTVLTCSNALGTATSYCDKFILYPILGGESVSVYYSASIVGKLLHLVSAPLNSVLLSYLVKIQQLNKKEILKKIPILLGSIVVAYGCCTLIGYPLTSLLYPQWAHQSKTLIPITVAISMFTLISNLINTIIMRFYKLSFQIVVQLFTLAAYFVLTLTALHLWGLIGFCFAAAVTSLLRMLLLTIILLTKQTSA